MSQVDQKTEDIMKRTFLDGAIAKRNKIIVFVLNLALVIPHLVQNYSLWGLIGTVILLLMAFYFLIIKKDSAVAAVACLPALLFYDVCIFMAISYQDIADNFSFSHLGYFLTNLRGPCITLFVIGLALNLFTPKKAGTVWLRGVAKTLMGMALIMQNWTEGGLFTASFLGEGQTFMEFFLLFSMIWFTVAACSTYADQDLQARNNWLSTFLLFFLFLFCTVEKGLANRWMGQIGAFMDNLATDTLAWWKIILASAVCGCCAVATYDQKNKVMGVDSVFLMALALGAIVIRVLMTTYFSFNWIVLPFLLVGSVRCLKNEVVQKKTLRLPSWGYLAAQFVMLLLSIHLLVSGLWINLLVLVVYLLIFYTNFTKLGDDPLKPGHWILILTAPAAYAIAYLWSARFSVGALTVILVCLAMCSAVMLILNRKHPAQRQAPVVYKVIVCGLMVLLCLMAAGRHGTKVKITLDKPGTTTVAVEARGKKNKVESVTCQWRDKTGKKLAEEQVLPADGGIMNIGGEILTVTVKDTFGVKTTKTYWYTEEQYRTQADDRAEDQPTEQPTQPPAEQVTEAPTEATAEG